MLEFWSFASSILADVSKHLPLNIMKCFKVWIDYFSEDSWSNCRVCRCVLDEINISVSLKYTSLRCLGHWLLISSFVPTTNGEMPLWVKVPALQA